RSDRLFPGRGLPEGGLPHAPRPPCEYAVPAFPSQCRTASRVRIVSADVFAPPTTSTSGIRCGGLNGCPVTQRSGCLHSDWIRLLGMPEVLDATSEERRVG